MPLLLFALIPSQMYYQVPHYSYAPRVLHVSTLLYMYTCVDALPVMPLPLFALQAKAAKAAKAGKFAQARQAARRQGGKA